MDLPSFHDEIDGVERLYAGEALAQSSNFQ
jgi:hypothetical protein